MYLLPQDETCMACKKNLSKGTVAISVFAGKEHFYFCPEHDYLNLYDLIPAILKFRAERGGKRSLPPITDYEYQLLLQSGAMLPWAN